MAQQTSDHVKPCNIGQSEQHNRRNAEYLARINKGKIYIRTDLMPQNVSWSSPLITGMTLAEYHAKLAAMVKAKTGRAMQTKERKKVDKKTGKVVTVSGSSPIRESVVVCKADTTLEQLQRYCQLCHKQFGITAIQIHIHRDEGHYENPKDKDTWKPNYHAHIVWDWMNHETGKSCKLSREDMSRMQDMVAEALQMERGTSKSETKREHLERNDFIVAEQKRKSEMLDNETQIKKRISSELDSEIAEKQERCNTESGNAILSGIANLAGRGKYAAIERENEQLKETIKSEREEAKVHIESERKKHAELSKHCDFLSNELRTSSSNYKRQLAQKDAELAEHQHRLQKLLGLLDDVCRKAVETIIEFARDLTAKVFSFTQAENVNNYMKKGQDREVDASLLLHFSRPFLSDIEFKKACREVFNVVENFSKYEQKENERLANENRSHAKR